ncbi:hypothetical protein D3C81_664520 [compost metagenome]
MPIRPYVGQHQLAQPARLKWLDVLINAAVRHRAHRARNRHAHHHRVQRCSIQHGGQAAITTELQGEPRLRHGRHDTDLAILELHHHGQAPGGQAGRIRRHPTQRQSNLSCQLWYALLHWPPLAGLSFPCCCNTNCFRRAINAVVIGDPQDCIDPAGQVCKCARFCFCCDIHGTSSTPASVRLSRPKAWRSPPPAARQSTCMRCRSCVLLTLSTRAA